ncbi:MAG: hypothetical protein AB1814_15975 [Thermodesulfobacteriota bacterium]
MAPIGLLLMSALAVLAVGCGIKTPPQPSSLLAPAPAQNLEAEPRTEGMMVSFGVPGAPTPQRAVRKVRIYYAYLPLTGDPSCPPCPPVMRRYHEFDLRQLAPRVSAELLDSRFRWLDKSAPMNQEAAYQVELIDEAGRLGPRSSVLRMPRMVPAAAPKGLQAKAGDKEVRLSWQPVTTLQNGQSSPDLAGYVLLRKGPDGQKRLNMQPFKAPAFIDKTVANGQEYSYQVFATRQFHESYLQGQGSNWVSIKPRDMTPPKPPLDLAAASTKQGVYLRYTPSPDQDVAGYNIFRKQKGGDWQQVNTALVKENVFVDKAVQAEKQYFYRVQAVDEAGNVSKFSEVLDLVHLP